MKVLAIALVLLAAMMPARAQEVAPVVRAIEDVIRPGFATFAAAANDMSKTVAALCAKPDSGKLGAARASFAPLITSWSAVEMERLGPLAQEQRAERILFWPDRRGIALRQVQAALSERAADVTNVGQLEGKSVALQGLAALEYLLFGTDANDLAKGDDHRCKFAEAVANAIKRRAIEAVTGWGQAGGFADIWSNPSPDNPQFRTRDEALAALLKQVAVGFEIVRDLRSRRLLPPDGRAASHKRGLLWRSGLTLASIEANVDGLERLLETSKIMEQLPDDAEWVVTNFAFEVRSVRRIIAGINVPLARAVTDPESAAQLAYLVTVLSNLQDLVGRDIAGALGTGTGFSSLDGD